MYRATLGWEIRKAEQQHWLGYLRGGKYDVAQAFSHWSWVQTGGKMLVCDLQGVYSDSDRKWLLTDPVVHTRADFGFPVGVTDLRSRGINAFFKTHKCNRLCDELLRPTATDDPGLEAVSRTSFAFEVLKVSQTVHQQTGGTCYAHAVATAVRAAESRIVGRTPETHAEIVERIVSKHGSKGGRVKKVLEEECPKRCLRYRKVSYSQANEAIQRSTNSLSILLVRRPIVRFLCVLPWRP